MVGHLRMLRDTGIRDGTGPNSSIGPVVGLRVLGSNPTSQLEVDEDDLNGWQIEKKYRILMKKFFTISVKNV